MSRDVFPTMEWYGELQEIRSRLSIEESHLERIRELEMVAQRPPSELSDLQIIEVVETLLPSYYRFVRSTTRSGNASEGHVASCLMRTERGALRI